MSPLSILVKVLTALYQARKVNDKTLCDEIFDLYSLIEVSKGDVFTQDKKVETAIRDTISWIKDQPADEAIIKSMLLQRTFDATKGDESLRKLIDIDRKSVV